MNCRLYAWVSGWWQERGRGILRLNDWDAGDQQGGAEATGGGSGRSKEIRSRLVFRTQGTLTVMLNTKVGPLGLERTVLQMSESSVYLNYTVKKNLFPLRVSDYDLVWLQVWADMSVERVSSKNVRFTALDADGQPKIFIAAVRCSHPSVSAYNYSEAS